MYLRVVTTDRYSNRSDQTYSDLASAAIAIRGLYVKDVRIDVDSIKDKDDIAAIIRFLESVRECLPEGASGL